MPSAKILIVSDAWHPQINGVVRTLDATCQELIKRGHHVTIVGPLLSRWCVVGIPSYPSIRLEFFSRSRLARIVAALQPDYIHIATEGPLGWAARNLCLQLRKPFTTSYHTQFPEYVAARSPKMLAPFVKKLVYAVVRRFHAPSSAIMVATATIANLLMKHKFRRIVYWSRGVDTNLFWPRSKTWAPYENLSRPILLYVGRVAIEKNIEAFLKVAAAGTKVVIGDGPDRKKLALAFPEAKFVGEHIGEDLAAYYSASDLFVFPSKTETFGLVILEALASGLRVASYPAPGPSDILMDPQSAPFAVLDQNLELAIAKALSLPDQPQLAHSFALTYSWQTCTDQFYEHLQASTPMAVRRMQRLARWLKESGRRAFSLVVKSLSLPVK